MAEGAQCGHRTCQAVLGAGCALHPGGVVEIVAWAVHEAGCLARQQIECCVTSSALSIQCPCTLRAFEVARLALLIGAIIKVGSIAHALLPRQPPLHLRVTGQAVVAGAIIARPARIVAGSTCSTIGGIVLPEAGTVRGARTIENPEIGRLTGRTGSIARTGLAGWVTQTAGLVVGAIIEVPNNTVAGVDGQVEGPELRRVAAIAGGPVQAGRTHVHAIRALFVGEVVVVVLQAHTGGPREVALFCGGAGQAGCVARAGCALVQARLAEFRARPIIVVLIHTGTRCPVLLAVSIGVAGEAVRGYRAGRT